MPALHVRPALRVWHRRDRPTAREPEQARDGGHRAGAAAGDGAALRLSTPSLEGRDLVPAFRRVRALIDAFVAARAGTPPPAELAPDVAAWRRFAEANDGVLVVGAMAAEFGGDDPASVATVFDADGRASGTRVEVCLHPPLDRAPEEPASGDLAAVVAALRAHGTLHLAASGLRLELEAVTHDPAALEPVVDRARGLARALRTGEDAGPYR